MARDFSRNTANRMNIGTATFNGIASGKAKFSIHCWVQADSYDTANAGGNRLFGGINNGAATHGFSLMINDQGANPILKMDGRSQSGDAVQSGTGTTTLSTGVWWAVGGVLNLTSSRIDLYVNGAAEGATTGLTFGGATYTTGTPTAQDGIGEATSATVAAQMFDGRIAELAIWTDDIGAGAFSALAKGVNPFRAASLKPSLYYPLWGTHSPEIELIANKVGTISGTINAANHPPVSPFTHRIYYSVPNTVLCRFGNLSRHGHRGVFGGR